MIGRRTGAIGFDGSLRHGAAVYSFFEHTSQYRAKLLEYRELTSWTKRNAVSLTNKDYTLDKIGALSKFSTRHFEQYPSAPVVIDFNPTAVHWRRSNPAQMVVLGLFVGYLSALLTFKTHPVIFLTAREVRAALGLKGNAKKEVVWEAFGEQVDLSGLSICTASTKVIRSDQLDSLILSYTLSRILFDQEAV